MRPWAVAGPVFGVIGLATWQLGGPQADGHPLSLLMRSTHLASVGLLLGGSFLFRLLSSEKHGPNEKPADDSHSTWMQSWSKWTSVLTASSLLSGLYFVTRDWHLRKGDKVFHSLFGTKMLFAGGFYFLSAAVSGKAHCLSNIRKNRSKFLNLNLVIGLACVGLGTLLRAHNAGNL